MSRDALLPQGTRQQAALCNPSKVAFTETAQ